MCFFVSHRLADFVVGDVGRTRLNRGQKAGSVRVRARVEGQQRLLYACFVRLNDRTSDVNLDACEGPPARQPKFAVF